MTMRPLQNQVADIAVFGVAVAFLGFVSGLVRDMASRTLASAEAPALLPATSKVYKIDSAIPKAQRRDIDVLDRLIREKRMDINWEKWPHGSTSDARKAVYKDILEGFNTVAEAREYVEGLPEDNVIFTARGDEIPFSLIKVVIADIERNPWLSPFRPEQRPDTSWQPPLMPATSIPGEELRRIADKYGWWAAKLAEAVCPHNDVACVESEAKRLAEARRARLE